MTATMIRQLFKFLDSNSNGSVSLNELATLVHGLEMSFQDRMNSFSPEFEKTLKREIYELFDQVDSDKDGCLDTQEILKIMQPTGAGLSQVHAMIAQMDGNSDGRVSKDEFASCLLDMQKKQLLEVEGQLEDIRKLFREVALQEGETLHDDYV